MTEDYTKRDLEEAIQSLVAKSTGVGPMLPERATATLKQLTQEAYVCAEAGTRAAFFRAESTTYLAQYIRGHIDMVLAETDLTLTDVYEVLAALTRHAILALKQNAWETFHTTAPTPEVRAKVTPPEFARAKSPTDNATS